MKKLIELRSELTDLIEEMGTMLETLESEVAKLEGEEAPTEEEVVEENSARAAKLQAWEVLNVRSKELSKEIEILERQEELNKNKVKSTMINKEEKRSVGVEFRDFLQGAMKGESKNFELRADPIITSTDADIINKTTTNGIDILTSPGEEFLRTLGVTFYEGLTGNFAVPSMSEDLATFPGEDASAVSANMTPDSLVLAARRLTHTQSISRETLAQTNPGIYASIVQNLVNGIGNAIVKDVMATVISDSAGRETVTGTTVTNLNIVQMEASIGGLNIGSAAYVTTPTAKSKLKTTIARGTTAGDAIWLADNTMNGYPAYAAPQLAANHVVFGDWSKEVVGKWGPGYEIIVDPYSNAKKGLIDLTIIALVDTGCANPRAFAILDASLA